jgi:predicted acylesterase/phospholipase RssA
MAYGKASRRSFLLSTAAMAALPSVARAQALAQAALDPSHPGRVERALALSGGGARGAYHAGIIEYLRLSRGIVDGQPLSPYGIIVGTSIGALNGYLAATGQYTALRELWYTIAQENAVQLKPQFAKVTNPQSGIGTRIAKAMGIVIGLASDDTGVLDGEHLRAWMVQHFDLSKPILTHFAWSVTNLTTQSPEFFYMLHTDLTDQQRENARMAIKVTVGPHAVLRECPRELVIDALRASAAIPVAFDPVVLPAPTGSGTNQYVDGGVTANTPIGVARAAALNVDVVLLDPPLENAVYTNAVEVGLGMWSASQRRILESDLRSAYVETFGKRAIERVRAQAGDLARQNNIDTTQIQAFTNALFDSNLFTMRPKEQLPVGVGGFDDRENLWKTYKLGFEDAHNGFIPYEFGNV